MITILRRFFAFCSEGKQKQVLQVDSLRMCLCRVFEALKIPAIAIVVRALIEGNVTSKNRMVFIGIDAGECNRFGSDQVYGHDASDRRRL